MVKDGGGPSEVMGRGLEGVIEGFVECYTKVLTKDC